MTLWPMTCMALWPVTYDHVAHDLCPCGRWSPGNLVCGLWLICLWLLAYGIITYIGVREMIAIAGARSASCGLWISAVRLNSTQQQMLHAIAPLVMTSARLPLC